MTELAIRCRDLRKRYPPDVQALDGLDLEVERGLCFGLLGPNGAGKTTTVEILEGLLEATSGEVEILGRSWANGERTLRQEIGISLQETRFAEKLTVRETVSLFGSFYEDSLEPGDAIALVELDEKANTWVGRLSGGQKQRLEIACALVGKPSLLFLDEPTTGLDPSSRRQLWEVIRHMRSEGRTIVLTTHYMDEAEKLCDRIAIIDRGRRIAEGTPAELISSLGGEHVIEFTVDESESGEEGGEATATEFASLPGVRESRSDERGLLCLTVTEPRLTLPALLERLSSSRRALGTLSTRHASLEDVFVRLTGRHLEDDNARSA